MSAAQPAFGQLPPIPPAADAAWVYPQDDRHTSSNGQVLVAELLRVIMSLSSRISAFPRKQLWGTCSIRVMRLASLATPLRHCRQSATGCHRRFALPRRMPGVCLQDAHGAGSGGRAGHSRGRVGAAAADDVPGSSKAEREKARRERLNERCARDDKQARWMQQCDVFGAGQGANRLCEAETL